MRGNRYDVFEDDVADLIRRKAEQLVGKAGLTRADVQDIEQELAVQVFMSAPKFDPARAQFMTFISRVVDRKVASLLRKQKAGKRGAGIRCRSLSEIVEDEDGAEVESLELLKDGPFEEAKDLELDLRAAVADLPSNLRDLCMRLQNDRPAQVARETGIARSTLYGLRRSIKQKFADAGLDDYF